MRQIEILAPAGSFEGLKAAVSASCDAVYIGGNKFGARAYANNLDEEAMLRAIDYAHLHHKKIYMTVNTLFKNSELEQELYEYLAPYYKQGLDAVIVQDPGVLHFVHEHFPELPIHVSTQMSLTMAQGAETLRQMGITRLVNARELSLEEIRSIRENTDLEIESFVHGALCYCYSGQCLMSSMIGGRSGNRGRCAQPCRMPYELRVDNKTITGEKDKYLLSPKDICTLDRIPQLIEAGIHSFKIEGRMKRPEYAAGVTYTYGKYVDKYFELGKERYEAYLYNHKEEVKLDMLLLQDLYNRGGFSSGYYDNRNGKSMMTVNRPNHSGVHVGEVKAVKGNEAQIQLIEDINAQDILEIRDGAESIYEFTVKDRESKGRIYTAKFGRESKVTPGKDVYRTKNNSLLDRLGEQFLKEEKKEPIMGELYVKVGHPLRLNLTCRDIRVEYLGEIAEEALNQPMTEEKIRKQLMKTNDTSFFFYDLSIQIHGNVFIPVQKLNELRRESLNALAEALVKIHRRRITSESRKIKPVPREIEPVSEEKKSIPAETFIPEDMKQLTKNSLGNGNSWDQTLGLSVEVNTVEQLKISCSIEEVKNVYLNSDIVPFTKLLELTQYIKDCHKKCYLILPHIFRKATYELFLQHKKTLEDNTIDGYIIQGYEEYQFIIKELDIDLNCKEIITNYNLYVMNQQAEEFWKKLNVTHFTAPMELNYSELKERRESYTDIIVYGYIPVMISAQCLLKTTMGDKACNNGIKEIELMDRYNKPLQVKRHCRDCYNTIYNSQCLSLLGNEEEIKSLKPRNIRLNFTFESPEETHKIINNFVQAYLYHKKVQQEMKDYTRGHFKRGVE